MGGSAVFSILSKVFGSQNPHWRCRITQPKNIGAYIDSATLSSADMTHVAVDNVKFYEKLGFKVIKHDYWKKEGIDNYYMMYEEDAQ
jgi:ribosomal protein S18 acetylase RimI-like enzyme